MEPFPRRETLPKPNYIVLSNHQSAIACICTNWGNKPDCCSVDWKNIPHFSLSLGFHELERRTFLLELLLLFVVQHFPNISGWPSALLQLKHLCLCGVYWIDIWGAAASEWGFTHVVNTDLHRCRTTQKKKKKHAHTGTHKHTHGLSHTMRHNACTHTYIDSGNTQINTYPCTVLM